MKTDNFHEIYSSQERLTVGNDRKFGITMAIIFYIIAFLPLIKSAPPRWWATSCASILFLTALLMPQLLHPFNHAWFKFGEFIRQKITTPIIISILFFGVFTPIAFILKILKKDLLDIQFTPQASNWKNVDSQSRFTEQF